MRIKASDTPHRVVAVVYDRLCTFEFGCTVEMFALERPELEVPWYRFDVCSFEPGTVRAMGGVSVVVEKGLRALDSADTIVIPGWRDADERPPEQLLRALARAYERGARLCSICSGVFVLAAAGVLDGRRVTTHWRYAEQLANDYPAIAVDPRALYVDEGQILTSAGSAAGLDMFLHMVRQDFGARTANMVARRLVIPAHRDGGQAQYLPRPVETDGRGRIAKLMEQVRSRPAAAYSIRELAQQVSMSPRTLQRKFRETVGMPPQEWVLRERIGLAKDLLEVGTESLQSIASRVGFGSQETFRRHFRRVVGTSPSAYRRLFTEQHTPH